MKRFKGSGVIYLGTSRCHERFGIILTMTNYNIKKTTYLQVYSFLVWGEGWLQPTRNKGERWRLWSLQWQDWLFLASGHDPCKKISLVRKKQIMYILFELIKKFSWSLLNIFSSRFEYLLGFSKRFFSHRNLNFKIFYLDDC
jgi:hypothetical protein